MKNKIYGIMLIIILIMFYEIKLNYEMLYNIQLIDSYYHITNRFYLDNINYSVDPRESELLNCLYISRYMGQDWNKHFFYLNNQNDLSEYCQNLIQYVKDELAKELAKENLNLQNGMTHSRMHRYAYYRYLNEHVLYTRECIEITGEGNKQKCNDIQMLIEKHTDIKKNMCLDNVDNPLCNQIEVKNPKPILQGYFDQNMRDNGRDFYSKDRNYKKNETNNNDAAVLGTSLLLGIGVLVYLIKQYID